MGSERQVVDLSTDGVDERIFVRLGWWIIVVGVGGFLAWAAWAPLDGGVAVEAKVVVSGNRKAVQPLTAGRILTLGVADGDRVEAGQLLVELESTLPSNQQESLQIQHLNSLATENRLMAERDGLARIEFDVPLRHALSQGNVQAMEIVRAQQQLFESRRRAHQATLDGLEAMLKGTREQHDSLAQSLRVARTQRQVFERQLDGQRVLAEEGLLARNRLLETERQYLQLTGSISDDEGRLGLLRGQLQEYRLRLIQQHEDNQKELRAALTEAHINTADLSARLDSMRYEVASTRVLAPTAGIVSGLTIFTEGGVVSAGQHLMDIVPLDQPLRVEGRLPVQSVDKVKPGQPVELEFAAFDRTTTPRLEGTVQTVSADRLEDAQGVPYYLVEIGVDALQGRQTGMGMVLQPGMPVTAFVRTGERTLLNYLLKPLRDRTRLALTEE